MPDDASPAPDSRLDDLAESEEREGDATSSDPVRVGVGPESSDDGEEGDPAVTRRAVLSGLGAGGVGATLSGGAAAYLLGRGDGGDLPDVTAALLRDEETFGVNILQAGELDLELCWETDGDCTPGDGPAAIDFGEVQRGDSGTATLRCDLRGNPGWVWLRTDCPADTCGLEKAIRVTLWYDEGCDGERTDERVIEVDGTPIEDVRLCDARTLLHGGTLLDADPSTGGADPLAPDDTCCIGFEWRVDDYVCDEDDDLTLEFELFSQQRRHDSDPVNPWPDASCDVTCDYECPPCDFQGISFVAFCIEEGEIEAGDVTFTPHYDVEGEPYRVDWQSDVAPEWVVLYYGSNDGKYFENFRYDGQETSGSVTVNSPGHPYYDSKLLWEGNGDVTELGQCPRDPGPNLTDARYGCGVRYNFDDGDWDGVCKQPCSGE